jgi:hypothetical protein
MLSSTTYWDALSHENIACVRVVVRLDCRVRRPWSAGIIEFVCKWLISSNLATGRVNERAVLCLFRVGGLSRSLWRGRRDMKRLNLKVPEHEHGRERGHLEDQRNSA